MKKLWILVVFALLGTFHTSIAQTYPETVENNGYVFSKLISNDMSSQLNGWELADWTFGTNNCEFTPDMAEFNDGNLDLRIELKDPPGTGTYSDKPYWGAEYWTQEEYLYGRFVSRMKPNTPSGVVTSFFLMHIDWNDDFSEAIDWHEIDIEFAGTNDKVQFTAHWKVGSQMFSEGETVSIPDVTTEAHDWIIEWTPTYISFFLDDTLLHTFDDPVLLAEVEHSLSIRMNCWVSNSPGWVGAFDESSLPVTSTYEHIVYYELENPEGPVSSSARQASDDPKIFPNPFDQVLFSASSEWKNADFQVYDSLGRLINSGKFNQGKAELAEIPRGVYSLVVFNEAGERKVERVVK